MGGHQWSSGPPAARSCRCGRRRRRTAPAASRTPAPTPRCSRPAPPAAPAPRPALRPTAPPRASRSATPLHHKKHNIVTLTLDKPSDSSEQFPRMKVQLRLKNFTFKTCFKNKSQLTLQMNWQIQGTTDFSLLSVVVLLKLKKPLRIIPESKHYKLARNLLHVSSSDRD